MTLITTVAELEALPVGAFVRDEDGDDWHKKTSGYWMLPDRFNSLGVPPEYLLEAYGPLAVESSDDAFEPVSTRCCGHDCHDTALLRPGSTYLCPAHGDCSADIRKEADDEH